MITKIKTFDPKKRKEIVAGFIENDVFTRKINDSHYFRKLNAYGISQDVFYRLYHLGVKSIVLEASTAQFEASYDDWSNHGVLGDYGNGEQRFLNLEYFKVREKCNQSTT